MTLTPVQILNLTNPILLRLKEKYYSYLRDIENGEAFQNRLKEIENSSVFQTFIDCMNDANQLKSEAKQLREDYKRLIAEDKTLDFPKCFYFSALEPATEEGLNGEIKNTLLNLVRNEFNIDSKWYNITSDFIADEVKARLCLMNEGNFEETINFIVNKFDMDEIFNKFHNNIK
jgi:hypothetical protein